MEPEPQKVRLEIRPWSYGKSSQGTGFELFLEGDRAAVKEKAIRIENLSRKPFRTPPPTLEYEVSPDGLSCCATISAYVKSRKKLDNFLKKLAEEGIVFPDPGHLFETPAAGVKPEAIVETPLHDGMTDLEGKGLKR